MDWPAKAVTIFGMSGVGKTSLARMLRHHDWFHYSVDYRIGTRYMGEHIVDNFKKEAMREPVPARPPAHRLDLHLVQHHLREPRSAVDLSRQARQPRQGRHLLRRISASGRSSTARPRLPRCTMCRCSSKQGARHLWLPALHLRFRRLALRGGGRQRRPRPRHAQPRRPHPPALYPRARPNMPTSWSSGSATSPSRCITSPPS